MPTPRSLLALVALLLATAPVAAQQEVLASAKRSFHERSELITTKNVLEYEWFNGFKSFMKEPGAGFERVGSDKIPGGNFFSLAGTKARPGDIVHVKWPHNNRDKQAVFVYVGEETFPDRKKARSFFIYPYHTRLEYNTVPARKHRQYLLKDKVEDHWGLTLDLLYNFASDKKREVLIKGKEVPTAWMEESLWDDDVYVTSQITGGKGSYTLYRGSGGYLTLKSEMVFHRQTRLETCFFDAYADVVTYKGLNPYDKDKGKSAADARAYQKALIRDEITHPFNDSRRLASAFFRTFLYEVDKGKPNTAFNETDPDLKKYGWKGPKDDDLVVRLGKGELLGYWWATAKGPRWQHFGLEDLYPETVYKQGVPTQGEELTRFKEEFLRIIREQLAADQPVMVAIQYGGWTDLPDPADPAKGTWIRHGHIGGKLDPKREAGHWLKITGLRKEGNKDYIHFSSTMYFDEPKEKGKYFVEVDQLIRCLPRHRDSTGQLRSIVIPPTWKDGDPLPVDAKGNLPLGGYVPFLVRLKGEPVQVRKERPN